MPDPAPTPVSLDAAEWLDRPLIPAAAVAPPACRPRMARSPLVSIAMLLLAVGVVATSSGCNALRVVFPSHSYESVPPQLPALDSETAVLVFTKTNGFRHHEAIAGGLVALRSIAELRGWSLFHTENGAVHTPELLQRFDAVVWHNTSGDTLDADQKSALRSWIEAGGGFVGLHGAGGDPAYDWEWYVNDLIGAQFIGHIMSPQFQEATIQVEDRGHPATRTLPQAWTHTEEWYSFERSPRERGARVLMSVDEGSYDPSSLFGKDIAMGDHPIVWSHCPGKGRAFFSALGHRAEAWARIEHVAMLEGAMAWAAGLEGSECTHTLSAPDVEAD